MVGKCANSLLFIVIFQGKIFLTISFYLMILIHPVLTEKWFRCLYFFFHFHSGMRSYLYICWWSICWRTRKLSEKKVDFCAKKQTKNPEQIPATLKMANVLLTDRHKQMWAGRKDTCHDSCWGELIPKKRDF